MTIKKLIISLLAVATIILLQTECSRHNPSNRTLDRAETIIDSVPEEAASLLDIMASGGLDPRNRHRLALLRARLQYDGDSLPVSDSLMAATAEYFGDHGDRMRRMQSLFIRAHIRTNGGDYAGAMRLACEGSDLADELQLPLWQGRFAQLKATLFSSTGDYPNSAAYSMVASRAYARDNSDANRYRSLFTAVDAAGDYTNMMDYNRSVAILDSVAPLVPGNSRMDSSLRRYIIQLRIPAALHTNHPQRALDLLKEVKSYSSYRPTVTYILLESRALMSLDSFDRALPLVEYAGQYAASPIERIDYFESLKFIAINNGDINKIDTCNDSINILNANLAKKRFENDLSSTLQHIIQDNSQIKLKSAHNDIIIFAILVVIVFGLLVIALMIIRRRKKEMARKDSELMQNEKELKTSRSVLKSTQENLKIAQKELRASQKDLTETQEELETSREDLRVSRENAAQKDREIIELSESLNSNLTKISELKNHSSVLYILGRSSLNNLIDEYEYKKDNNNMHKQIVLRLKEEIEKLDTPETFREIEFLMNLLHNDTMRLLREEFPEMKEIDVKLLMLNLAGWSPRSIALFLKISKQNCLTKKSRLIARIRKSKVQHRDLFIEKFYYKPEGDTDN